MSEICRHFREGRCKFGDECRFKHEGPRAFPNPGFDSLSRAMELYAVQVAEDKAFRDREGMGKDYFTTNAPTVADISPDGNFVLFSQEWHEQSDSERYMRSRDRNLLAQLAPTSVLKPPCIVREYLSRSIQPISGSGGNSDGQTGAQWHQEHAARISFLTKEEGVKGPFQEAFEDFLVQ